MDKRRGSVIEETSSKGEAREGKMLTECGSMKMVTGLEALTK